MTDGAASVIEQLQAKIQQLESQLVDRQAQMERLAASEVKFRAIAEYASDTICTINHAGELTYLSPNVYAAIGYTPAELQGQPFAPLIHPDDLPYCATVIQQVMATFQPYTGLEYRVRHQQGHYVWHRGNLSAYADANGQPVLIAIGRDATSQKQTEAALAKSQAQFEAILQNANIAIFAKDLEGRYIFANRWVTEEVGLSLEDILGKTDADLLPADMAQALQASDRLALETGKAVRTEERVAAPQGDNTYLAIKFPLCDRDGKPYAVCGISTNITDLKRTEAALRTSEARLNQILDSALASIARYRIYADFNWEPEYFSSGTTEIWGFTPEEILIDKMLIFNRVHPEDTDAIIYPQVYPAIFAEQTSRFEYRYYHPKKQEWRWIAQTVSSVRDEVADCWLATVIATDVTDRKRTEEALRTSEARLNRILDRTTACIADYRVYADRTVVPDYFSSGSLQLWGFTPDEMLADLQPWQSRYEPEDLQAIFAEAFDYIFSEGSYTCEYRYHHPNGSLRWIQLSLNSYWDETENCWWTPTISIDVTDRKRAELALARSEVRFRQIVENASDLIATVRPDGVITYISPTAQSLLGYEHAELIGQHFSRVVHPDDITLASIAIEQVMATGENYVYEHRIVHRDRSFRYVVANVSLYQDEDGQPMLLGISRDVTEQKRLEEELRQSEAKFRAIVENANDTIATVTSEGRITYLSPNMLEMLGREASELIGTLFVPLVHPDDVSKCYESMQRVLTTQEPYSFEYRLLHHDGTYRHFVTNTSTFDDEHGNPVLLGISRDVTEQKRLEEELRQSEAKFRQIVENANDVIYLVNAEGIITYISPNVHLNMGYSVAEMEGQPFVPLVHPEDLEAAIAAFQRVLAGETATVEVRSIHKDGGWRWFSCQVSPFRGSNGELFQMGIARNMTERRRLEEELRQSELKFRTIVEQANDIIYTIDETGISTYVSPNIESILGVAARDMVETHFSQRIHPDDLDNVATVVQQALAGERVTVECRVRHQDGSWRWLDCNVSPMQTIHGKPGIMGIARDISDRKQLEEELRQSEYKFRAIVENANDLIYVIDQNGCIAYMSPNSTSIYGFSPAEMEGRTFDQFVHPEDLALGGDAIRRAISGERFSFEVRSFDKNGRIRWFNSNIAPFRMANGEMALMGIGRDVTDRKEAEDALQRSERKYRNIFENSHVGIGRARLSDAALLECNQRMANILGFESPEMLLGQNWGRFCTTEAEAQRIAILLQEYGMLWNDEVQVRHRDGSIRWCLSFTRVNYDEDCLDFVVADITDRKRLEEDLRQSQQFLNSVIDNIPLGFFAKDVRNDYRYVLINKCAERFMGFSREQGLGRHDYELLPTAQADYYGEQDQTVVRQRSLVEIPEAEVVSATGGCILARILKFPLFDDQGTLTHLLCLTDDITERKQREEELRLAKDAAEAANRAKSTFLANMSHELRTPLNVILGFTQLMERENALSDRQRNFITTINRSGEHLLNLINDVLEMSKIEAGRITLNPEPFDLRHLLSTLKEMFRVRAEAKRLLLTFEQPSDLPTSIIADEGKLRQVLINLLSNAVKFTEQGTITLTVELVENDGLRANAEDSAISVPQAFGSHLYLRFSIADTGIGIAPTEIEQLFQPFVQTTGGLQVKEGTGLGLTISRQFVQLMGGDIQIQSQVGQGSRFVFQIPVTLTNAIPVSPSTHERQILSLMPGQPIYRLLIVDDRMDNRNLLTHLLESFGFETRTASNGQEAIACWQTWSPHLIWMDMRMPIMDGYEATRQIRELERQQQETDVGGAAENSRPTAPTKIIALTASAFEEQRTTVLAAGCDDFVRKPFRDQVIFDKLTEHLGVQFSYAEPVDREAAECQDAEEQSPVTIQVMPPEWIRELQQAAIAIDGDRLLHLVADIPAQHAKLAEQLRALVKRFCFDEILDWIAGETTDE